jgi:F-type H+-transporting ATPase subunit delta
MQLLRSPVIHTEKKQKVIKAIFDGKVSKLSMRYLDIITNKKRELFIPQIAEEYLVFYKKFKNIITVHFTTASAVNDEIRKKVVELLEKQTGSTVELVEDVKNELIGGFVLDYEDYQYDASIAYLLRRLKKSSAEVNLYKREI